MLIIQNCDIVKKNERKKKGWPEKDIHGRVPPCMKGQQNNNNIERKDSKKAEARQGGVKGRGRYDHLSRGMLGEKPRSVRNATKPWAKCLANSCMVLSGTELSF